MNWLIPVSTGKPYKNTKRGLSTAGREVVDILKESQRRLILSQIRRALPHVPSGSLRRRLTEMYGAGAIVRAGCRRRYEYGWSSTCGTT